MFATMEPKKKRISGILFLAAGLLLLLLGLHLVLRYGVNEHRIRALAAKEVKGYDDRLFKANYPVPYVPYYNTGNVLYESGDYKKAEGMFQDALRHNPVHNAHTDRACDVRVNLALSVVYQMEYDNIETDEQYLAAVRNLKTARNYLTADGCANPEAGVFDGHDADAEQLKKEIDELLEKLREEHEQNQQEDPPEDEDNNDENGGGDDDEEDEDKQSRRERELEREFEEQRRRALERRAEGEEQAGRGEWYGNVPNW